jgi:hypothetical protein
VKYAISNLFFSVFQKNQGGNRVIQQKNVALQRAISSLILQKDDRVRSRDLRAMTVLVMLTDNNKIVKLLKNSSVFGLHVI